MNIAARRCLKIIFSTKSKNLTEIDDVVIEDNGTYYPIEDLKKLFFNFSCDYIDSITRPVQPDNIIFAFDKGKSWRKSSDQSYKQDRKQKRDYDPKDHDRKVQSLFKVFKSDIIDQVQHFNRVELEGLEGDDIISIITEQYFSTKDDINIIWSADADLKQLVNFNCSPRKIGCTNIIMSPNKSKGKKQIHLTYNLFQEYEQNPHIAHILAKIKNAGFIEKPISPEEIIVDKIIKGDKSDSIPSFYHNIIDESITKGKVTSFVNKQIIQNLKTEFSDSELMEFTDNIFHKVIDKIRSYLIDSSYETEAAQNLNSNKNLVKLSSNIIPKPLQDQFLSQFSYDSFIKSHNTNTLQDLKYKD
jgi:hypothetical protein